MNKRRNYIKAMETYRVSCKKIQTKDQMLEKLNKIG